MADFFGDALLEAVAHCVCWPFRAIREAEREAARPEPAPPRPPSIGSKSPETRRAIAARGQAIGEAAAAAMARRARRP